MSDVAFYPENKIGTSFTRILQDEETETYSFIHLLVHRPLTKATNPRKTFRSRGCILTTISQRYIILSCFKQRCPRRKGVGVGFFVGTAHRLKNQGGV